MNESWWIVEVGLGVMLVAITFMAAHYRQEMRRKQHLKRWQAPFEREASEIGATDRDNS
jgi:hypothetical protein